MKSKILIINQNSGYLTVDVVNAFTEKYDEVVVMYGLNRVSDRNFNDKIKFQKTISYNRSSTFLRLWTWTACSIHIFFLLIWKYRNYNVLYYSNPPMSYFSSLFFSNPFSIVIFDLYPDALRLIGVENKTLIFRLWSFINRRVFDKAEKIITLSEGMKSEIKNYVDDKKIKVVSVWPASENFKPVPKNENLFLKIHDWERKFIILYSGNMGKGHKLEILIDLAKNLEDISDILFLFIGEGSKKSKLEDRTQQNNLKNVEFLAWQEYNMLPYSLAAGNIAVVALEQEATNASVPSKTYNYMAAGAPILAIGGKGSELESLVSKYNIGFYLESDNLENARSFIIDLYFNESIFKKYSSNSYQASKNFSYKQSKEYLF